jgi:hypothetical protein
MRAYAGRGEEALASLDGLEATPEARSATALLDRLLHR